jgi:hypothetical protein
MGEHSSHPRPLQLEMVFFRIPKHYDVITPYGIIHKQWSSTQTKGRGKNEPGLDRIRTCRVSGERLTRHDRRQSDTKTKRVESFHEKAREREEKRNMTNKLGKRTAKKTGQKTSQKTSQKDKKKRTKKRQKDRGFHAKSLLVDAGETPTRWTESRIVSASQVLGGRAQRDHREHNGCTSKRVHRIRRTFLSLPNQALPCLSFLDFPFLIFVVDFPFFLFCSRTTQSSSSVSTAQGEDVHGTQDGDIDV